MGHAGLLFEESAEEIMYYIMKVLSQEYIVLAFGHLWSLLTKLNMLAL